MGEGEARVKHEGRGVYCRRARAEVAMLAMREAGRRARGMALLMAAQRGTSWALEALCYTGSGHGWAKCSTRRCEGRTPWNRLLVFLKVRPGVSSGQGLVVHSSPPISIIYNSHQFICLPTSTPTPHSHP